MPFQVRLGITSENAEQGTGTEGTDYIELPISSTYKTTSTTVVDSSRNSEAYAIFSVVRKAIRKIELSWRVISVANYSMIAKFLNENFTCYAYYFDQDDNEWQVREIYVGDRVADALQQEQWKTSQRGGGVEPNHIQNYKLSLIEV